MRHKTAFFMRWRRIKQSIAPGNDFQQRQLADPCESHRDEERHVVTHTQNVDLRSRNLTEKETELKAELINFHIKENRAAHKTDNFHDKEQLLLRRGQAFDVTVKFNRDYNPETDVITLHFVADHDLHQSRETTVRVEIRDVLLLSQWGMQFKEAGKYAIHLSVMTSAQAMLGHYDVMVETNSKDSSGETSLYRCQNGERICLIQN